MNEQEVRALVREAIERHLGRPPRVAFPSPSSAHPSHIQLNVLSGSDVEDGMCVIEPAVRCTHCGFCQSYGH
jgi:hypothetical protein